MYNISSGRNLFSIYENEIKWGPGAFLRFPGAAAPLQATKAKKPA